MSFHGGALHVSDEFAWLCAHSGNITLSVEVDSEQQIPEAHEANNVDHIDHLQIDTGNCTGDILHHAVS